jgi:hypothetical protein
MDDDRPLPITKIFHREGLVKQKHDLPAIVTGVEKKARYDVPPLTACQQGHPSKATHKTYGGLLYTRLTQNRRQTVSWNQTTIDAEVLDDMDEKTGSLSDGCRNDRKPTDPLKDDHKSRGVAVVTGKARTGLPDGFGGGTRRSMDDLRKGGVIPEISTFFTAKC